MSDERHQEERHQEERRKEKSGRGGCLFLLAGVAFLLIGVPLLSLLVWTTQSFRRAQAEIDRLQRAGAPISGADLDASYTVQDADLDVTALWLPPMRNLENSIGGQAYADLPIVGEGPAIPRVGTDWPQRDETAAWLATMKDPLARLHQAAKRKGSVRYPAKLNAGVLALLPHASHVRNAARVLALEAEVNAHRGDAAATARSIQTGFALGRTLEREPLIISQLVRFAVDGVFFNQLARHLGPLDFSDEDLRSLQETLQSGDYDHALTGALTGERAIGIQAMRDPAGVGGGGGPASQVLPRGDDMTMMLTMYEQILAVSDKPYYAARPTLNQADLDLRKNMSSLLGRFRFALSGTLMPSFQAIFAAQARVRAERRAAATAVAMKRFEADRGRLPSSLQELVPQFLGAVPEDPFDGKPLRYRKDGTGFMIYSVGTNLVDDGGVEDDSMTDVVFRVTTTPPEEEADGSKP